MRVSKGYYGWTAESEIELDNNRAIKLTTMKRANGQLATTATVGTIDGNSFSFMMFQDFTKVIKQSKPSRVTAKVVELQHESIDIEQLKNDVAEFYKKEIA